jgi:hypothetical protein
MFKRIPLYWRSEEDMRGTFLVDGKNRSYFVASKTHITPVGWVRKLLGKSPVYRCWMYPVVGHQRVMGEIPIPITRFARLMLWAGRAWSWMGKLPSEMKKGIQKLNPFNTVKP